MTKRSNGSKTPDSPPTDDPTQQPRASSLGSVIKGRVHVPSMVFLYGTHGIGKSTFASQAPAPIFIQTEDGANEIDCDKLPTVYSQAELMEQLRDLYSEEHSYRTVVIDSVDWLEDFIRLELQRDFTEKELAYGRESLMAEERIGEVLAALNHLRLKRSMTCLLIAHSEIKRFDSPITEPYDRYQPKLQQRFSALLQEWADAVLFANYEVAVQKEDVGFNQKVRRGIPVGGRLIYTEERPAFYAKNRYSLPPEIALEWEAFAKHVPYYSL